MATKITHRNSFGQTVTFTARHIVDQLVLTVEVGFPDWPSREERATFILTPDQADALASALVVLKKG